MVRLKAFCYELKSNGSAQAYFADGKRKGLLLAFYWGDQAWGMGEYAPLSGIHRHSIEESLQLLAQFDVQHYEKILQSPDPCAALAGLPYPLSLLLSTVAEHHAFRRYDLSYFSEQKIALSALITASDCERALSEARHFLALGYTCLKLKIGTLPLELEIEKIRKIDALCAGVAWLRLDANKRYHFLDAVQLVRGIAGASSIQYIEEPLCHNGALQSLKAHCDFAFAVDESYEPGVSLASLKEHGVSFLIIKASRFHSLSVVRQIVTEAVACGIRPIFSTCFESEFFASMMALLVAQLGLLQEAHGLFCPGIFESTLHDHPLPISRAHLYVEQALHFLIDREGKLRALGEL